MIKLHKTKYWYIFHKKIITTFPFALYLKPQRERELKKKKKKDYKRGVWTKQRILKKAFTNLSMLLWKCLLHKATYLLKKCVQCFREDMDLGFCMGFYNLHQIHLGLAHSCQGHSLVLKYLALTCSQILCLLTLL